MDVAELWQEHKRWILGCAVGVLVYLIGGTVIRAVYGTDAVDRELARLRQRFRAAETYRTEALRAARAERDDLAVELHRLRAHLEFRPEPRFRLEARSEPADLHFSRVQIDLRRELLDRANNLNVDLSRASLVWPAPVGDEIPDVLLGLGLLDQAVNRLLDAHQAVIGADPDAFGLQVIDSFKVDGAPLRGSAAFGVRTVRRQSSPADLLEEQTVSFAFRADSATTMRFLESCRDLDNPISFVELSLHQGAAGEPLQVRGKIAAITFRDPE